MKKQLITIILSAVLLSACGEKTPPADDATAAETTAASTAAAADDPDKAESATAEAETKTEEVQILPEESTTSDAGADGDIKTAAEAETYEVGNEFFTARLKEFSLPEGEDETVTVVFEFTNITDKTYYKNDEEIPSGGTWEKIITYPRKRWVENAEKGTTSWIHYDLYEDGAMHDQIYKGGLVFAVNADLQVADMSVFDE